MSAPPTYDEALGVKKVIESKDDVPKYEDETLM